MTSNISIDRNAAGRIRILTPQKALTVLTAKEEAALRDYFQAERDAELGRWRDPVNPDFAFYPLGRDKMRLVFERTGYSEIWRREYSYPEDGPVGRYFAAHPKEEPKPWLDAEPGELWEITYQDESKMPALRAVDDDWPWRTGNGELVSDDEITAATRIYPPAKDGN